MQKHHWNAIYVYFHNVFHLGNTQTTAPQDTKDVKGGTSIPATLVKEGECHSRQQVPEVSVPSFLFIS